MIFPNKSTLYDVVANAQSLGVAKRDHVKDPSGFNSGVFVFSPNQKDYASNEEKELWMFKNMVTKPYEEGEPVRDFIKLSQGLHDGRGYSWEEN